MTVLDKQEDLAPDGFISLMGGTKCLRVGICAAKGTHRHMPSTYKCKENVKFGSNKCQQTQAQPISVQNTSTGQYIFLDGPVGVGDACFFQSPMLLVLLAVESPSAPSSLSGNCVNGSCHLVTKLRLLSPEQQKPVQTHRKRLRPHVGRHCQVQWITCLDNPECFSLVLMKWISVSARCSCFCVTFGHLTSL